MALILLVAVGLRLYRLNDVPPGMTHDEAANGMSAVGILEGQRPLYFTIANGREPLYVYSMVPAAALLGPTVAAVRLTSVLWGLALILVTWAWVRCAFNPRIALLAAAGLAIGFWPLMLSRLGLRAVTLPVLFTAAIHQVWVVGDRHGDPARPGAHARNLLRYLLAGLLLGVSFYTYMASRALPAVFFAFFLYLVLIHPQRARATGPGILAVVLVAVVVALPLFRFLSTHPEAETRIEQLAVPWQQARAGDWAPLRDNVVAALKIFSFDGAGDPHWIYNLSGRPLLDPLSGLLFYAGLLIALWRWRDPAHFFSLAWLAVGLGAVLVTGANSSMVRAVAAQPVVFVLQALALDGLAQWASRRGLRIVYVGDPLSGLVLLVIAGFTIVTYFDRWPNQRDVRVAYHTPLAEIAHYLDAQPAGGTAVLSSIYPGPLHDPYSFELLSGRDDLDARWFDGRYALLLPDVDQAFAVFPALAPLDAALVPYFSPHAQLLERVPLRKDDLSPWFEVYRWQPRAAVDQLPLTRPKTRPIDVGHVVAFVGHQLLTPVVPPGGTVELLTFWRVPGAMSGAANQDLVLFSHVFGPDHQIVGQQDRLDVPAWNWSPGDHFVQLHRFPLDTDLTAGLYSLEIGVYSRAEGLPRLTVFDPDRPSSAADSIPLPPVEVRVP